MKNHNCLIVARHRLSGTSSNKFAPASFRAWLALKELKVHLSHLYRLRTDYLRAYAQGRADLWTPAVSGGESPPRLAAWG